MCKVNVKLCFEAVILIELAVNVGFYPLTNINVAIITGSFTFKCSQMNLLFPNSVTRKVNSFNLRRFPEIRRAVIARE